MMRQRFFIVLPLVLAGFSAFSLNAAEKPQGARLMRPDSLDGWDHGPQPPSGWTIAEGQLCGTQDATPLLSGFTAGDVQLGFRWSVADEGVLKISLPEVPNGPGLELLLREGDGCGALRDGDKTIAPGATIEATEEAMHEAVLSREGDVLTVRVDDKPLARVSLSPQRRFGLGLAVARGKASIRDLRAVEPLGKPLFNGKNLDGWQPEDDKNAWSAKDDCLVLKPSGGCFFLRSIHEHGNFTLSLEYWMPQGGNSGLGIRTPRGGWPSRDGMEIQFMDVPLGEPLDEHAEMDIYGGVPPLARADKPRQWNRVVVKADGWMISAWVNGELVQQYNTLHHPELKHRLLRGWVGFQDHGAEIHVRDVRLLDAPDGNGLDVWSTPKKPTAETAMVDRLMNPETLSRADGVVSGVITTKITTPGEHVLADLAGPGAVVRLAPNNAQGVLAFYFDGETKPRIECKPEELWKQTPPLNEDPNPVLTYMGYQK